jgi:hypothetical protein
MANNSNEIQLVNKLISSNPETVAGALQKIKESGSASLLPYLFKLLKENPLPETDKAVKEILGTVKTNECIPEFVKAIQNPEFQSIKKELIELCWQNGLDFGPYMPYFIEVIASEEWEIAFEAFTLLENLKKLPSIEILAESAELIRKQIQSAPETNRYFLGEILKIIEN